MNKLIILSAIFLFGCTKTVYIPTKEYIKGKDSIVIQKRDSIIYVDAPEQFNENITNQKSHLETDYSISNAWIDSSGLLHHNIANVAKIPQLNHYESKFQRHDSTHFKTITLLKKEKVIQIETALLGKIDWALIIVSIGYGIFRLLRKFKVI